MKQFKVKFFVVDSDKCTTVTVQAVDLQSALGGVFDMFDVDHVYSITETHDPLIVSNRYTLTQK